MSINAMAWDDLEFLLIAVAAIVNIVAVGGLLYLLIDRYACLRAVYRLLRCLREAAPKTYRYLLWPSPFQWMCDPQRLEEFLLSSDLEEHDGIRHHKEDCRCWLAHYRSVPAYLRRIGGIALASGAFLMILLILAGMRLNALRF